MQNIQNIAHTLRIGTVGTSSIMDIIVDSLQQTEGMEPAVVYSRSLEKAKRYAREHGVAEACDDFEELIFRKDLDVIYLASPNMMHAAQAVAAMEAGKHVIVEKPAGVTRAQVEQMELCAGKHDVFFLEAVTTIFMPNFVALKELLPKIGKIRRAKIVYGQYSSKYDAYLRGENPNIFNPAIKAGALNDMGIYCIHAAVDLFGAPQDVRYEGEYGPNGIDLAGTLTLTYPDRDLTVELVTAKNRAPEGGSGLWIEGEHGTFTQQGALNEFYHCTATIDGIITEIDAQGPGNRMIYEHAALRDCILQHDTARYQALAWQSRICADILERAHQNDAVGNNSCN